MPADCTPTQVPPPADFVNITIVDNTNISPDISGSYSLPRYGTAFPQEYRGFVQGNILLRLYWDSGISKWKLYIGKSGSGATTLTLDCIGGCELTFSNQNYIIRPLLIPQARYHYFGSDRVFCNNVPSVISPLPFTTDCIGSPETVSPLCLFLNILKIPSCMSFPMPISNLEFFNKICNKAIPFFYAPTGVIDTNKTFIKFRLCTTITTDIPGWENLNCKDITYKAVNSQSFQNGVYETVEFVRQSNRFMFKFRVAKNQWWGNDFDMFILFSIFFRRTDCDSLKYSGNFLTNDAWSDLFTTSHVSSRSLSVDYGYKLTQATSNNINCVFSANQPVDYSFEPIGIGGFFFYVLDNPYPGYLSIIPKSLSILYIKKASVIPTNLQIQSSLDFKFPLRIHPIQSKTINISGQTVSFKKVLLSQPTTITFEPKTIGLIKYSKIVINGRIINSSTNPVLLYRINSINSVGIQLFPQQIKLLKTYSLSFIPKSLFAQANTFLCRILALNPYTSQIFTQQVTFEKVTFIPVSEFSVLPWLMHLKTKRYLTLLLNQLNINNYITVWYFPKNPKIVLKTRYLFINESACRLVIESANLSISSSLNKFWIIWPVNYGSLLLSGQIQSIFKRKLIDSAQINIFTQYFRVLYQRLFAILPSQLSIESYSDILYFPKNPVIRFQTSYLYINYTPCKFILHCAQLQFYPQSPYLLCRRKIPLDYGQIVITGVDLEFKESWIKTLPAILNIHTNIRLLYNRYLLLFASFYNQLFIYSTGVNLAKYSIFHIDSATINFESQPILISTKPSDFITATLTTNPQNIEFLHNRVLKIFIYWFGKGILSFESTELEFVLLGALKVQTKHVTFETTYVELRRNPIDPGLLNITSEININHIRPIYFRINTSELYTQSQLSIYKYSLLNVGLADLITFTSSLNWPSVKTIIASPAQITSYSEVSLKKTTISQLELAEISLYGSTDYKYNRIFSISYGSLTTHSNPIKFIQGKSIILENTPLSISADISLYRTIIFEISYGQISVLGELDYKQNRIFAISEANLSVIPSQIEFPSVKTILIHYGLINALADTNLLRTIILPLDAELLITDGVLDYKRNRIFEVDSSVVNFEGQFTKFVKGRTIRVQDGIISVAGNTSLLKTSIFPLSIAELGVSGLADFSYDRIFSILPANLTIFTSQTDAKPIKLLSLQTSNLSINSFISKLLTFRIILTSPGEINILAKPPFTHTLPSSLRCWFYNESKFYSIYEFYGVFVALLRNYFSNTERRLENSLVDELVWPNNLRIELSPGIIDKISGNLPAVFVTRGPLQQERIGIGDRYITRPDLPKSVHSTFLTGEVQINVISYEYNQTLLLASEIINLLQYYRRILSKYLDIRILLHPTIKGIKNVQAIGGNAFVVVITFKFMQRLTIEIDSGTG